VETRRDFSSRGPGFRRDDGAAENMANLAVTIALNPLATLPA
jgi:hypothetical protein